jgi:hypothetical protein
MMILSRLWYVILALLLAAAYYVVALAVGQYNRRNQAAMEETLKADSQVVSWAMQVDARRRLDVLLLAAVDPTIAKAIRGANGKDAVPPGSKDDGAKALRAFNEKLPAEYKNDVLFIADREGRLVAQIGFDSVNGFPEFELGGYPAVFDALHGFLRDDTWVWGGKIARVVARPVEDDVTQPPLGAVIGLRWVDNGFAKEIGKRTRTNIAFFALGQRVASAATTEGFDEASLETIGSDLKAVGEDKGFKEAGRTDVRPLGEDKGALFVRLPGDAWELGAGFAVARARVMINSPTGFISGADDTDKKNVKLWLVALVVLGASLFGMLFTFLEHSLALKTMASEALRLKKGETDTLQVAKFRGGTRAIATDINAGLQRVVEKGGGTARKPADLESILGPVPAQPNMSAFSFPLNDGSQPPVQVPQVPPAGYPAPGAGPGPGTGTNARFPGAPPPPAGSRPSPGGLGPQTGPFAQSERTMAMPSPNTGGYAAGAAAAPTPAPVEPGRPPFAKPANAPPPVAAAAPPPPAAGAGFQSNSGKKPKLEEDVATVVANPGSDGTPMAPDPAAEWQTVYEEFIRTKRECGEPTDGLTFEKFQQTLKKNRDALMQRHGCKRVKFSVYVKEGRASLKATPVRD